MSVLCGIHCIGPHYNGTHCNEVSVKWTLKTVNGTTYFLAVVIMRKFYCNGSEVLHYCILLYWSADCCIFLCSPLPRHSYVEDYIKAYYLSEEDTEAWIRQHKVSLWCLHSVVCYHKSYKSLSRPPFPIHHDPVASCIGKHCDFVCAAVPFSSPYPLSMIKMISKFVNYVK